MAVETRTPTLPFPPPPEIVYPDSDGQPMADNTLQFQWIVTIQGGLDALFADRADVVVAGDLLWYPVQYHPEIRVAPDALVAFGRPKGYRGSYKQWEEGGIAPQVVFEILSPGNTDQEMERKHRFYERYGVEEYYLYDPDTFTLSVYVRQQGQLNEVAFTGHFVSALLGVRFEQSSGEELVLFHPTGQRFLTFVELEAARAAAETALSAAEARAERLAARLRALGIDPDQV